MEEKQIIEEFCTLYGSFKRGNPEVKGRRLKLAFDQICEKIFTKHIDFVKNCLSIDNFKDFKSFVSTKRSQRKKEKEEQEIFEEIKRDKEVKEYLASCEYRPAWKGVKLTFHNH